MMAARGASRSSPEDANERLKARAWRRYKGKVGAMILVPSFLERLAALLFGRRHPRRNGRDARNHNRRERCTPDPEKARHRAGLTRFRTLPKMPMPTMRRLISRLLAISSPSTEGSRSRRDRKRSSVLHPQRCRFRNRTSL